MDANIVQFSIADYVVFCLMLAGSLGIGVYFAIKGNKTTEDFLLASRSLSPLPVALSLIATYFSSISILGYIGEVYGHGIQMATTIPGKITATILGTYFVIPVFYELKLRSVNEYVELRFRSVVLKKLVLIISSLNLLLYLGICLYAPTLALESVTPLNSTTYVFVLGVVVTLYSSFGGLKAVVWTDAFQTVIIMLGILIVTISSIIKAGGFGHVFDIAEQHGRLDAGNFNFGLYKRHTVINTFLSGFTSFSYLYCFSQATIQRIGTLNKYSHVNIVMVATIVVNVTLVILLFLAGLGIFAVYAGCDPIQLGFVDKKDQILPLYVMQYLGFLTGVPGIFVACLFSGTLSSISSVLNSLPTMIWVDFLSELQFFKKASENVKTITTKLLTFLCGVVMVILAILSSQLGGLIQAAITILSIVGGPVTGVFLLGVAVPICGKKGATAGLLTSIVLVSWISIGAQLHKQKASMLPLTTDLCENSMSLNVTNTHYSIITTTETPESPVALAGLYDISYTLYGFIGLVTCLSVALIVTFITGREDLENVDPSHVLHCLRQYVGPQQYKNGLEMTSFVDTKPDAKTPNKPRDEKALV